MCRSGSTRRIGVPVRGIVLAAAALLAGCDGSDFHVETVENLAALGLEELPARFCCEIPSGQPLAHIGSIRIDPAPGLSGVGEFTQIGMAINDVTPDVLGFRWDGWFIADGNVRAPTAIPNLTDPPDGTLFNPALDIGGFSDPGMFERIESYTLHVYAASCEFDEATFVLSVFEYRVAPGLSVIEILRRQVRTITIVNDPSLCAPPAPPPSELLVFTRRVNFGASEIWTSDRDGNETQLTNDAFYDIDPVWSPDRGTIAFASNRANHLYYDLYTMDADGPPITPATAFGSKWVDDPDWAPNGHEIAMTVGKPGQLDTDLWIVDLDLPLGPSNPRQLTSGSGRDLSPTWSPDGTEIAFVRDGDILVVPADGSSAPTTRLAGAAASSVDWSAQGMLAYDRYDPQYIATRIWKANAATGLNATRVSDGVAGFADTSPAWSSDGTKIAFVREKPFVEDPDRAIHVMGADGADPRPIGNQPGDIQDPDW